MTRVGIVQIGVQIPKHFISAGELAEARGMDPRRATQGLGVIQARVPLHSSVFDLAAQAIRQIEYDDVERVYFATESDGDAAKPDIAVKTARELGLRNNVLLVQTKFACLSGVQNLVSACEYAALTGKPAIVVIADRSVYDDATDPAAEVTLGCGAVALRIAAAPKIEVDFQKTGVHVEDTDDFRVPYHSFPFPILDGKLSTVAYAHCVKKAYEDWKAKSGYFGECVLDRFHLVFHVPFPKMVEWAAAVLWREEWQEPHLDLTVEAYLSDPNRLEQEREDLRRVRESLAFETFYKERVLPYLGYNRHIGNAYTAAVFIALIAAAEEAPKEVLLLGYGSGAGAIVMRLNILEPITTDLAKQLNDGEPLSVEEYEKWKNSLRV